MKKLFITICTGAFLGCLSSTAQGPVVTTWLINSTDILGRHYNSGNPTSIDDTMHANVQLVRFSDNYVYINCSGIPSYVIGPYQDGNPSQATNRNHLFKIPRNPVLNTGTKTEVGLGQIGVLINGVPVYNYADAMSYNNLDIWHRNAVYFENAGFDCSKGHPSPVFQGGPPPSGTLVGGTYHHHQNPCAYDVSSIEMSDVCAVYAADGLYIPNSSQHSPLIGYSFDGFPIYGGYGFANSDGTGGIKLITPSWQLRNISDRTTLADGTVLESSQYGPTIANTTLGAYAEDFEFVNGSGDLDIHNGRVCVTPEYPQGTYAYFATIDSDNNSVFPYVIGETYYGVVVTANFPVPGSTNSTSVTITETVETYNGINSIEDIDESLIDIKVYPNPANNILVIQSSFAQPFSRKVELLDAHGKLIQSQTLYQGSTMCYFDVNTVYAGNYFIRISVGKNCSISPVTIR